MIIIIIAEELRNRTGILAIGSVLNRNRLRWFGHVGTKDEEDWVKKCMYMEVEGARSGRRQRKTRLEVALNDMKELSLARVYAL